MEWLHGIWNDLTDIFKPRPESKITWHAMDTPDWVKPISEIKPQKDGVDRLTQEEMSPFIFLGLLILILYFLTNK